MAVRDRFGVPDTPDDLLWLVVGAMVVVAVFVSLPSMVGHARFALRAGTAYMDESAENLTFTQDQIDRLNAVSDRSLGFRPPADERMYCFSLTNRQATEAWLVDDINDSERTRISGACRMRPGQDLDGVIHTQPGGDDELSEEDRDLESPLDYVCIQYDRIVEGPQGSVGGLKCWETEGVADPSFTPVEVGISG